MPKLKYKENIMDIYNYLKKDHRKVSDLMKHVLSARSPARREEIFDEINEELTLHAETEEATFYAALENEEETEEKIEGAEEDHEEIKIYLKKLSSLSADSEKWMELFGEFRQAVEHHVKDEEERIFPKAKQILSDEEAEQLSREMARLKEEALENAAA
jgi:hemerythrin superfamily protein